MNILILTYEGDIAGSTNSIAYLAKGLAERGHHVYLGCRKESLLYRMLINTSVNLIAMEFKGKLDLKNIRHIGETVKKHKIQIINAQSSYDRYTSILAKLLYRMNVKLVHTRRQVPQSVGGWLQNTLYIKGTDKMVAVSKGVKNALIKMGLPSEHIEIIYNGTPKEKYDNINQQLVEELKLEYQIKSEDFVIGCVSRLKSQIHLIQALKYVSIPVKVIFIGIRNNEVFDNIIKSYSVPHQIFFIGGVDSDQILNYYKLFTIKILASTMEGLSQSLLEAMSLGIPVVATDSAGNPDLVKSGENGLLYENNNPRDLAEKIELLLKDHILRNKLAKNGQRTALEDFSIDNTVGNYEVFFKNLLEP